MTARTNRIRNSPRYPTSRSRRAIGSGLVAVIIAGGCSAQTPSPPVAPTITAASSAPAPSSLDSTQAALVRRFIDAVGRTDDAALGYLVEGSVAYTYIQASLGIARGRNTSLGPIVPSANGYTFSGVTWSDFQVNRAGKITTFKRNDLPIERAIAPVSGRTVTIAGGKASTTLLCFRYGDVNSPTNRSLVLSATDRTKKPITIDVAETVPGAVSPKVVDTSTVAPGQENFIFPSPLGAITTGTKITISIEGHVETINARLPALG